MRADRLLSILLLLQVGERITARELAQRLEVSERTIYRDMDALSASGIPVLAERGSGGGWSLLEAYRTHLTGLNQAEIQALFAGKSPHLLAGLGLDQASNAALIKLQAALPEAHQRNAEDARQRLYVDVASWRRTEEAVPFLHALQEAVWQARKLHFSYGRGDGNVIERVCDPLGLVSKGSLWYLVACVEGEMRTYRVSRMQSAWVSEEPCVRPPHFDLAAYWQQSSTEFLSNLPRYLVTVRAQSEILPRLRSVGRYSRVEQVEPADVEGWCVVQMAFENPGDAREVALSFGPHLQVLAPPELRSEVIAAVRALAHLYET